MKPQFDEVGLKFFNCDPESNLNTIPYIDYGEAVDSCKLSLEHSTAGMYEGRKDGK